MQLHYAVTQFLTQECHLLDTWELRSWLDLFSADARYAICPMDYGDFEEGNSLYLALDDRPRLEARVHQIMGGFAWTEKPKSRTRRIVSNIFIHETSTPVIDVRANGVVFQFRNNETCSFVGEFGYRLRRKDATFQILEKRIQLDHESLQDQRRISIVL